MMPARLAVEHDLESVTSEWDALVDASGAGPFHRPGWHSAWWGAFGRGTLEVVTLRDKDGLAAVLPLRRRRGRLTTPANWHTPVFGPVGRGPEATRELFRQLFVLVPTSVELWLLDESDGTLDAAAGAALEAGRVVQRRHVLESPYVPLRLGWEALESQLSPNRRKNIRRRWRALEHEGRLHFEILDGGERVDALLAEVLAVEASGWKGARGTAMASNPTTRSFYTEVARWAAARGWLRLAFLRLEGRPLAVELALEHGGSWYSLKAGYEVAFARYGPGGLLLHAALRHACERGLERFELLGTADDFKLSWTRHALGRGSLRAHAPSVTGRVEAAAGWVREGLRTLKARVAQDGR